MAIERQYPKNISSLKGLELTCEGDEGGLTAKLTSLQLAKDEDDNDITAADYEIADGINLGHLIFEEFTTEIDAKSLRAIHRTRKEPFVCEGSAFVSGRPRKVIVFRERMS